MIQHTYTGQYSNRSDFARPGSVAAWDRYAYVENNPLRYTDPSGHDRKEEKICDRDGYCGQYMDTLEQIFASWGISFSSDWSLDHKKEVFIGIRQTGRALARVMRNRTPREAFFETFGPIKIDYGSGGAYCQAITVSWIQCSGGFWSGRYNIVHELGHVFNVRTHGAYEKRIAGSTIITKDGVFVTGYNLDLDRFERGFDGYKSLQNPACQHCFVYDKNSEQLIPWDDATFSASEEGADMFMNWVWWEDRQIGFSDAPAGQARRAWMTVTMTDLVGK